MLDKTKYTVAPPASTIDTISGQAIAKSQWDPRTRARFAAKWKLGLVLIDPTTKLAADIFKVSVPLVMEEIENLEVHSAKSNGKGVSPNDALDTFVRANLNAIWDAVERVTRT